MAEVLVNLLGDLISVSHGMNTQASVELVESILDLFMKQWVRLRAQPCWVKSVQRYIGEVLSFSKYESLNGLPV